MTIRVMKLPKAGELSAFQYSISLLTISAERVSDQKWAIGSKFYLDIYLLFEFLADTQCSLPKSNKL